MRLPHGIRRLLRLPAGHRPIEREIDDELSFHFAATISELRATGLTSEEALREATRRFGDVSSVRRTLRSIDRSGDRQERRQDRIDALRHDSRAALRSLVHDRRVALFVVLTLMLGLGANATMFGIVDRMLLRPPPHVAADENLTSLYVRRESRDFGVFFGRSTSYPGYAAIRAQTAAFSDAAAVWHSTASLGRGEQAVKVTVALATANLFPLLGVRAERGRFFLPDEDRRTASKGSVVISHGLWTRQFGSDEQIIGREIQINQGFYAIVGIAPAGFNGARLQRVDAWVPMHVAGAEFVRREFDTFHDMRWLEIIARRREGVSAAAAAAQATAAYQASMRAARKSDSTSQIVLASMIPARGVAGFGGVLTGDTGSSNVSARVAAWLGIVAAIVLAIAGANVANLLLLRAAGRRREIALRLALGVSRARLATQLLMESGILAVLGGAAALAIVPVATGLLRATLIGRMEIGAGEIDMRLILFTTACVIAVAVAAGLAPLSLSRRMDLNDALKSGVREGGVRKSRLRVSLIVMQGALSMLLLVGAGLFVQSLRNVSRLELGFDPDRVMVASIDVSGVVTGRANFEDFWRRARERVAALPTVERAAQSVTTPLESGWSLTVALPDRDSLPPLANGPFLNAVSPEFFATLGTRIVRGRGFAETDLATSAPVAVISEAMARYLWPDADALGKCYYVQANNSDGTVERSACITVIGISETSRSYEFRSGGAPEHFVPLAQSPAMLDWRVLLVRGREGVSAASAALDVRRAMQGMAANLPFADVRFLREAVAVETRPWELGARMFGLFGILALLIAAVGLYSTIAYEMAQRSHEFGVRQALGARAVDVGRLVAGRAVRYALPGVVLGLTLALGATRWIGSLLFGVSPRDPLVYATVAATLIGAALIAAIGPARRAQQLDPLRVLRDE